MRAFDFNMAGNIVLVYGDAHDIPLFHDISLILSRGAMRVLAYFDYALSIFLKKTIRGVQTIYDTLSAEWRTFDTAKSAENALCAAEVSRSTDHTIKK